MATEPLTASEARERLKKLARLATGRLRIERAETILSVRLLDVWDDDDLVVIFCEEAR